jgi:RHS repeat-associated protein
LITTAGYDLDYRLTSLNLKNGTVSVSGYTYAYGDKMNLTGITDTVTAANSNTLSYSATNRLASASGAWGSAAYSYDAVGNRLSDVVTGALNKNRQSSMDSFSNRITGMTENAAAFRTYSYDGAGNIATDVRPGETYAYVYNKRNRLSSVTRNATSYATYIYNALEQLTSRVTSAAGAPAGTVHYIYDLDGHLIVEADAATGATLREYIWLPSNDNHVNAAGGNVGQSLGLASLAANDNNPVDLPLAIVDTVSTAPTLLMVHSDHLGRPIRLTDATKATVWQATYKPWGETQSISGTRTNNLRLPGQYFQIETNLAYNWHRHYDPVTGRYTQPDPLRFVDGPAIYAYAKSSPFMRTDRSGLFAIFFQDDQTFAFGPLGFTHASGVLWDFTSSGIHRCTYTTWGWAVGFNAGVGKSAGWYYGNANGFSGTAVGWGGGFGPFSSSVFSSGGAFGLQGSAGAGADFGVVSTVSNTTFDN